MLFEDEFYQSSSATYNQIVSLATQVDPQELAALAYEARTAYKLRHVPLLLLAILAQRVSIYPPTSKARGIVADTIEKVIQRADELSEFLAIYGLYNNQGSDKLVLSGQVKKGLARAFNKFDAYQLAKYDRKNQVRLRDALFLCHAKPQNAEQAAIWKQLIAGELPVPDTWEVALVRGADKKETFERLLSEGKLGYLALLRNLRNMAQAGCDTNLVEQAILARKGADKVLPFRFTAAAKHAPQFEKQLDQALLQNIDATEPLPGKTIILVDISGSMEQALSGKSDLTRMDAAATLGSMINGDCRVFSFSYGTVEVPVRRGMAGRDAIVNSQSHGGTDLGSAVDYVNSLLHDRLIVITDEQSQTPVGAPKAKHAYMINVSSYTPSVGYGDWTRINGFSEAVLDYIRETEKLNAQEILVAQ
jgi:hypothetical protein